MSPHDPPTEDEVLLPYPWSQLLNVTDAGGPVGVRDRLDGPCWASVASVLALPTSDEQWASWKSTATERVIRFSHLPLSADNSPWKGSLGGSLSSYFSRPTGMRRRHHSDEPDQADSFIRAVDLLATQFEEALSLCDEADGQQLEETDLYRYRHREFVRIPWVRLYRRWMRDEDGLDPAPLTMIARMAPDHSGAFLKLAQDPRRLLNRKREEERIDRIQELDPHCLLDYAQRPGRTMAQKAGRSQRLLAVTRKETVDTLENRVLRDLLETAMARGMDYCSEYRDHTGTSSRVRKVASFCRGARLALRNSRIAEASELHGGVQPNYVLLRDTRYQKVWSAWRDLRDEEKKRRELWLWARRLWAETVRGWIISGLHATLPDHGFRSTANRDAILRRSHEKGVFFLPGNCSERFAKGDGSQMLDLVHPKHFGIYPSHQARLHKSGSEMGLVKLSPKPGKTSVDRLLLVYSLLPGAIEIELPSPSILASLKALADSLPKEYRVLLVVGHSDSEVGSAWNIDPNEISLSQMRVLRIRVGDSEGLAALARIAMELINHE